MISIDGLTYTELRELVLQIAPCIYGRWWFCPDCNAETVFVTYRDLVNIHNDAGFRDLMKCERCGRVAEPVEREEDED